MIREIVSSLEDSQISVEAIPKNLIPLFFKESGIVLVLF
jgi:hypothetical protein